MDTAGTGSTTAPIIESNSSFYPGLVSGPTSIAFMSNTQYLVGMSLAWISTALSLCGSGAIMLAMLRSRRGVGELSNRLIFGISVMDIIVCFAVIAQPLMMRKDSGLLFAMGNMRTCDVAGFVLQFFMGVIIYNCILSIYFLLRIKYNRKDYQIVKYMEPYVHILAVGEPLLFGTVAIYTKNFNPYLPLGVCTIGGVYPPACGFRDDVPCERGGTTAWAMVFYLHSAIRVICIIVAAVCTFLVYWTARQQLRNNTRYSIHRDSSSSSNTRSSMRDALTPQQRKIIESVSRQAVLYFLVYLSSVVAIFAHYIQMSTNYSKMQDVSELSATPGPAISLIIQYFLFPLNGLLNMIIFFRPRVVRWKDLHPDRSWFWAYRQVLNGTPVPLRVSKSGINYARDKPIWSLSQLSSSFFPHRSNPIVPTPGQRSSSSLNEPFELVREKSNDDNSRQDRRNNLETKEEEEVVESSEQDATEQDEESASNHLEDDAPIQTDET